MMNYQPMIASVIWFSLALIPVLTQVHAQGEPLQVVTTPAATQPVVDGVINEQEWSDACKLEGTLHQVTLLRDTRPITFWVKADAKNVYVAMRSTVREREWKWQGPTTWFDKGDSSFVIGLAPGTVNHGDKPSRYLLRVNMHDQQIAWEVTPQIKGVQLTYPHPKWLHKAVIKSGLNEDRTQWTMEASIPLASMNVDSISSDTSWGLLLARDYAAADPTAIVLSNDWRFGDGKGRIYGRAFYNHYRNEAQWAQLHFNANHAPSSVVVGSDRSSQETPDVPDFAMIPFQKGAGLLVPDAELKRYGVYTSSGTLSKNTTATGYEPITNEFYAKLKIGTLPEVSKAVRSELVIRPLGSREALLTHDMPGLKPELNLRLTSTYPNAARSTVVEWISPSDGLVDVNYDCLQGNPNMSDGVGFGLVYVNAQIPESRVLIARRQLVYADGWVPFSVKQLAVKAGDKIQLHEDKWGGEGNDIGRLRGSLTLTDSNGKVTTYSPAADFAMEQGGTNGVWFYRFDDDVIPNADGVYPQLLWQSQPNGHDGWMWFEDNEGKLNPWKGNPDTHAGRPWGCVQLEQNNVEMVERFKLPVLSPGVYEVEANVYADKDRLIGQAKQLFIRLDHVKDLPWMGNELGVSSKVLAPWTPMTAEHDKNGLLVSCWGRTHQVNQGGLFEQITAKSADSVDPTTRDILASAIRIEMDRDGKTEILKPVGSVKQGDSENHKVEWQSSVEADGWKVQVDVDMAYDGYALHKLLITPPAAGATVDRLRLVIPIQPEQATHLHAAAGQWFRATVSAIALDAQMGQLWHSGRSHGMDNKTHNDKFGRMMAAGDFKPYVWVGGANRGLAFMADNDRGWVPDDSRKTHAIEVIREEGRVNLILNLVARPFAFDKPRAIEFSLQATPVKPLAADHSVGILQREYELNALGLPKRIVSQGENVMASPARLVVVANGKEHAVDLGAVKFTQVKDWRVSFKGQVNGAGLNFEADGWVEQDGLVYLNLTYGPSGDASVKVDSIRLEYPLSQNDADSLLCVGPGENFSSRTTMLLPAEKEGRLWSTFDTGITGSGMTVGSFYPTVWVGSERRGFVWWADNDRGWIQDDAVPAHEAVRKDGAVVLINNIVGKTTELTGRRTLAMSYNATPFKPMVKGWRATQSTEDGTFFQPFRNVRKDSKTGEMVYQNPGGALNHVNWMHPESRYPEEWAALWAEQKVKADAHAKQWMWKDAFRGRSGFNYTHMSFQIIGYGRKSLEDHVYAYFGKEWEPDTWNETYTDYAMTLLEPAFKDGGVRSTYWDLMFPILYKDLLSGLAYQLPDGRVQNGYNGWNLRHFFMRLHALQYDAGVTPGATGFHSTNAYVTVALPWGDAVLDGERDWDIDASPLDWVDNMPIERMRSMSSPHIWGVPVCWMGNMRSKDRTKIVAAKGLQAQWIWMHDSWLNPYVPGFTRMPQNVLEWGINDKATVYHPYWRNTLVTSGDPDVLVSMWQLPDRVVIGVFNYNRDRKKVVSLKLDLKALNLVPELPYQEFVQTKDLWKVNEEQPDSVLDFHKQELNLKNLPPHTLQLIGIRRY